MAERDFTSSSAIRKPLFAAATLPSSSLDYENQSQEASSSTKVDLESLTLELAPTTLDAIIAAQKPSIHEPRIASHGSDDDQAITDDVSSQKRKSYSLLYDPIESEIPLKQARNVEDKPKVKKKRKKEKHKKKRRHSRSRSSSPVQRETKDVPKIPKGAIFLEEIRGLKPEHAFHIDRKSNKDLWHYESVSKLHIARYRPFTYSCIGDSHISLSEKKDGRKTAKKNKDSRYFGKEGVKQICSKGSDCIVKTNRSKYPEGDFIGFPKVSAEKDKIKPVIGSYSCLDEATKIYSQGRSTDYNVQPELISDSSLGDEIFEKIRRFNERTREEPENVQLWLEFADLQDVVTQEDKHFRGQRIKLKEVYRPPKSVIEKKLAILDKALEANPSSLELKLAQLDLYQDIWEADKLEKAWQNLLFVHAANVDLWRQYLSNQQSRLFKFSFSRVVKCYHKCFQTLIPILDGQVKVLNKKDDMEEKMIGLFSQYCDFLHHTGYTERAVSSYQALIELNLFSPPSLNLSHSKERVEKFEEFWESGMPRFGEPKAKGWTNWEEKRVDMESGCETSPPFLVSTDKQEDTIVLKQLPRSQTWLEMERVRQDAQWLPWKPDTKRGETEDDCEDLDRLVLFDDISPAMFRLTKSESCIRLVCLFLKFLGLSCEMLDKKLSDLRENDENLKFEQFSTVALMQVPALSSFKVGVDAESTWKPHDCMTGYITEVLHQAESYFIASNRVFFTLLRVELEILKTGSQKICDLSKSHIKSLKKFGKNLLKESQNRNNLVVWDSYIRLLWASSEKMSETMSMVDTALGMFMGSSTFSDLDKALGLSLLCKTYCQIMLNFEPLEHIRATGRHSPPSLQDKHQVIACLSGFVENKSFKSCNSHEITPAFVLKIRKSFQRIQHDLCSTLKSSSDHFISDVLIAFLDCFALFELCASNLEAANEVYASMRKSLNDCALNKQNDCGSFSNLKKRTFLSQLTLISNVMLISIIPLNQVRKVLNEALQEFPECPQFHAFFLEIERGSHIAGRLRKFYESHSKSPKSGVFPLFAVMSEMMRHQTVVQTLDVGDYKQTGIPDSGIVHRIRSVCEHALQSQVSSHCPLLWRLYLMFEAEHGSSSRAKGIFYRALQNCPWAKCIYMDGIAIFGDSELQEVMDLMTEEELRVRMPMEEVDLLLTAEKEDSDDAKEKVDGDDN